MKAIDENNKEELLKAARFAEEPLDWIKIGDYFDTQRALVVPRETRDNPPEEGDS